MSFYCLFNGHNYIMAAYRHNGIHLICPSCGKQLWRPMDTELGEITYDNSNN